MGPTQPSPIPGMVPLPAGYEPTKRPTGRAAQRGGGERVEGQVSREGVGARDLERIQKEFGFAK